ncbi:hypothetical protein ACLMJK_003707 [Lecanora helva]
MTFLPFFCLIILHHVLPSQSLAPPNHGNIYITPTTARPGDISNQPTSISDFKVRIDTATPVSMQARDIYDGPANDADEQAMPATVNSDSPKPNPAIVAHASSVSAALAAQSSAGISLDNPDNSLSDPCGPPSQPPGDASSKSTCHANVSVAETSSKQAYGVYCMNDKTGEALNHNSCDDAMWTICDMIAGGWGSEYQTPDRWTWSTQNGNCTFGYWLPKGGAPPPSPDRCRKQILAPMSEKCRGPEYNVGAVNLRKLPSADASGITGTGLPVDGQYPSYIMVAQKSFCGVNQEDKC